jgi:hypothetical protein
MRSQLPIKCPPTALDLECSRSAACARITSPGPRSMSIIARLAISIFKPKREFQLHVSLTLRVKWLSRKSMGIPSRSAATGPLGGAHMQYYLRQSLTSIECAHCPSRRHTDNAEPPADMPLLSFARIGFVLPKIGRSFPLCSNTPAEIVGKLNNNINSPFYLARTTYGSYIHSSYLG